jgi:hypothetical protein
MLLKTRGNVVHVGPFPQLLLWKLLIKSHLVNFSPFLSSNWLTAIQEIVLVKVACRPKLSTTTNLTMLWLNPVMDIKVLKAHASIILIQIPEFKQKDILK